ncbi:PQQ-dependent sugar dehydrogenase [Adhaeribacter swui]|uniref:PQQ-dependent sugar dehydrogenase n=1 Tax=Adhaeribacter swui TaxID=2086471 RepID=A0A7G7G7S2_9BACT|nr:PQQ-dependent sugar dehydrogenase [Adhaeribacter swui]QNF33206.1 PQQ-dependent sugar dehydrogenase [Adhaeribacter swui]
MGSGCRKQSSLSRNTTATNINFKWPVERVITVDSTRLGVSTIITNLNVPWEITWGPDNQIWCTEQDGTISKINPVTGEKKVLVKITDVYRKRLGLLSMALHPNMKKWPYVFVNYTYLKGEVIFSKLVRYTYSHEALTQPKILLEFPAYYGHMGSRVVIASDGKIMWATGDGAEATNAQDTNLLSGKVLRLNIDGTIPADNPVKGSPVWASGFRVPQGMVYNPNGMLYIAEHGDATDDEVNIIQKGHNYGWPQVQGFVDLPEEKAYHTAHTITEPLKAWTPTIAPAGMDFYSKNSIPELQNSLLLTTLKESDLRVLQLNKEGTAVVSEKILLDQQYGRLRDVCVSPAGDVYVSTSNRDWNPGPGFPQPTDDRIIRIFKITDKDKLNLATAPQNFVTATPANSVSEAALPAGQVVYQQYCASCHKADGNGVAGTFPSLRSSGKVSGEPKDLIPFILKGSSGSKKTEGSESQMPAFHFLNDQQLAEVVTYIRSEFGNIKSGTTAAQVAEARSLK